MMTVVRATLALALASAAAAQTDILYLSAGDQNIVAGYQGGAQVIRFSTGLMAYPIAVSDGEIRISTLSAGGAPGKAFDLAGSFLRTLQTRPGDVAADAATDGLFNYFYTAGSMSMYRCDLDWGNGAVIFTVPGNDHGVTYDANSDSLWHANGVAINEYSLTGSLRSSFGTASGNNIGLAWEPSTDTLWTYSQFSNTFRQYSKAGALLSTVPFANPFADNFIGGEFEITSGGGLPRCTITAPIAGAAVSGDVGVQFDAFASMMISSLDAAFDFSTDGGSTWSAATPSAASPLGNPATGLATPVMAATFEWDSAADGVGTGMVAAALLRVAVDDGTTTATCQVAVMVDNIPPPISCTLALPPGTASGGIVVTVDSASMSSAMVTVTITYSTDAGATYAFATMTPSSPHSNPDFVATGLADFQWDSRADGVALGGVVTGVVVRAQVDDPLTLMSALCSGSVDIDNSQLCALCGDCDLNSAGPNILDALGAARIAAGLLVASPVQQACCDVNSSGLVNVVDALLIAQVAAGLPVALACI